MHNKLAEINRSVLYQHSELQNGLYFYDLDIEIQNQVD